MGRNLRRLFEIIKIRCVKSFPLVRLLLSKIGLSGLNFNIPAMIIAAVGGGLLLPFALLFNLFYKLKGKLALGSCALIITTHCTLKCRNCSYMIPHYKHPKNMELPEILSDIDKLLSIADLIFAFYLAGGEPFIHKDIDVIINKIANSDKIKSLNITTNGTILPDQKVIHSLRNKKITVQISGYPKELVPNADKLMEILKSHKIRFTYSKDLIWKDNDAGVNKNRNTAQRKRVFEICVHSVCQHLINGEFHICPVSANLMNNGVMQKNENDFANIRDLSSKEARKKIKALLNCKEVAACSYCDGATIYTPTIPPAIQMD